jgi:hypothetical protein
VTLTDQPVGGIFEAVFADEFKIVFAAQRDFLGSGGTRSLS